MIDFWNRFKNGWPVAAFPLGIVMGLLLSLYFEKEPEVKTVTVQVPVEVPVEKTITIPGKDRIVYKDKVVYLSKDAGLSRASQETARCLIALDKAEADRLNLKHLLDTLKR
jgi:hypothetical protein